jgi:hypothetical protein
LGIIAFSTFFYLIIRCRKNEEALRLSLLGLLWIASNFIIYFLYDPQNDLPSNARYLIPSAVGTAIFYSGIFSLIYNKKLRYLILALFCGLLIYYSRSEQNLIVEYVSKPDKQGFTLLLEKVKKIDRDTLFLFDVIDDPRYKNYLFGNVPQMGIPPLYGGNWEAKIADDVGDFINRMVSGESDINNFESFFYGLGGHVYTTDEVRELLKKGKKRLVITNSISEIEGAYEYEFNYPSYVPTLMTVKFNKDVYWGKIKVSWMTENRDVYTSYYFKEIDLKNLGGDQTILPAGGRKFRKIRIEFLDNPQNASILSISLRSLAVDELVEINYRQ